MNKEEMSYSVRTKTGTRRKVRGEVKGRNFILKKSSSDVEVAPFISNHLARFQRCGLR